jgi:hypothetical protein
MPQSAMSEDPRRVSLTRPSCASKESQGEGERKLDCAFELMLRSNVHKTPVEFAWSALV